MVEYECTIEDLELIVNPQEKTLAEHRFKIADLTVVAEYLADLAEGGVFPRGGSAIGDALRSILYDRLEQCATGIGMSEREHQDIVLLIDRI